MAIEWRQNLETGIELIDNQHKELFKRVNNLFEACNQGKGKEEVGNVMKFLEDYVIVHFKDEENLMIKYNYPEYQAHKMIHEHFIKDFIALKSQFDKHGASSFFVIDVNRKIVDWLVQHIGRTDKVFGAYLKDKM